MSRRPTDATFFTPRLADAMRGEDPVEARKAARKAPSVADLAADYLERHALPKKRPKSVRDDLSMLDSPAIDSPVMLLKGREA